MVSREAIFFCPKTEGLEWVELEAWGPAVTPIGPHLTNVQM